LLAVGLRLYKEHLLGYTIRLLEKESFDIIQYAELSTGELGKTSVNGTKTILDLHNVHSAISRRWHGKGSKLRQRAIRYLEWRRTAAYERQIAEKFSRCLTVSNSDCHALSTLIPTEKISVIPNGVDTQYFTPKFDQSDGDDLLYAGTMDYMPNVEAMEFFCHEVFPLIQKKNLNSRLFIVGCQPHPRVQALASQEGVIVTGAVSDVRPYFARCKVFVVPLLSGGGTRLKILEALSMEKAVISTTLGAEGLDLEKGTHLLLADRPEDFAEGILDLLGNQDLRTQLGRNGREVVLTQYDWSAIGAKLEGVYEEVVNG